MVGNLGLHGGVLGYMVESVWLHGGECLVTCWGVGLHVGVLSYMVGSVELHGEECWVTWWSVGLRGGECLVK